MEGSFLYATVYNRNLKLMKREIYYLVEKKSWEVNSAAKNLGCNASLSLMCDEALSASLIF